MNLVVVADDPLVRTGLAALLASLPGCKVVGQGSSNFSLDDTSVEGDSYADLVVWVMGWESDERHNREVFTGNIPILALVPDEEAAAAAWKLGARGVLMREIEEERLAAAISAVTAGLVIIAPAFVAALSRNELEIPPATSDLTPREREVLVYLAEGLTNKAIAQQMAISDHTVKFHVNSILTKLNAQSRTDAVVRATRQGLIAL